MRRRERLMGMVLGIVPFSFQDKRTGKHFLQTDTAYGKLGLYKHDENKATTYSTDIETARALATRAHEGQTDKAGLSYITHPDRVVARLDAPEVMVVDWLHDTVEDTPLTIHDIEAAFGSETAAAVDAISRREGKTWSDYLDRVAVNPIDRQVKFSDLIDNSNLSRIPHATLKDVERQKKYDKEAGRRGKNCEYVSMNTTPISKLISLVLRHYPEKLGLTLDDHGWAYTKALIKAINTIQPFVMEQLEIIVQTDKRQRYAFSPDKARILANQGHSIPVDLELILRTPPAILWHGTGDKYVSAIMREGLKPMGRQYVHLSIDPDTAMQVGRRHGRPVLFTVDAARMAADAMLFYRSENGIWLTDSVPPQYLKRTIDHT